MITIKELAKILGISHSTVSRALNDHPAISEKTKLRVKKEAIHHGYVVNQAANTMKGEATNTIGLLIPDIDNTFYARFTSILTALLRTDGTSLILSVTHDSKEQEEQAIKQLLSLRPKTIFSVPTPNISKYSKHMLIENNCIQLIRHSNDMKSLPFIGIDEINSMSEAVRNVYQKGHSNIAYLGPMTNSSTGFERLSGFVSTCQELGIASNMIATSENDFDSARAKIEDLWNKHKFSAIVLGGEIITQAVWSFLMEDNLLDKAPIKVVNFGEFSWSRVINAQKSFISLPMTEIAETCYQYTKNKPSMTNVKHIAHFID
ncbi:hypothetical protein VHA01S_050_00020 [Vibrio halioticoli NBRC 102217]|uniref:HTH lacI-type domain-containing protein n=1 Tax=Vibrio halioticoli NBRC 102217 TaxID=1219072 RepID=V5HN44_9VIBR|nr:LacI family DNA-binding transcriptional regulator [Vibrio halioticoli]GAD90645.1 hypothetical protein VHA01S_050_00020 [Vibrio halioticoli NBRC 102217]